MTQNSLRLDFVCVGPQRTGTSWLDRALRLHPAICLPKGVKETRFFDQRFDRGLDWYSWHFRHRRPSQLCGEIASSYFADARSRERLVTHSPNVKILTILRAPLERTESLYRHHLAKGRVSGSFTAALTQMPALLESGRYKRELLQWIDIFGLGSVTILLFDDLVADSEAFLGNVWDVLEVDPIMLPDEYKEPYGESQTPRYPRVARIAAATATGLRSRRLHTLVEFGKKMGLRRVYQGGRSRSSLSRTECHLIIGEYEEDIRFIEDLLGRELGHWRDVEGVVGESSRSGGS